MKKIIFTLYRNDLNEHTSVTDHKRLQFAKYEDLIKKQQSSYAQLVGADYECFKPSSRDYVDVQFEKLLKFEELIKEYDQVLYLDFDVIPITKTNVFDKFRGNDIYAFNIEIIVNWQFKEVIKNRMKDGNWHGMDMYSKSQVKKSMLLLDDIISHDTCLNTGVVLMNRECVKNLKLSERLPSAIEQFKEALDDNVYPLEMTKSWSLNNEVVLSYLIEKYDLLFTDIGMPWNFIMDHNEQEMSGAAHFLHFVHKKFENYFTPQEKE